MDCRIQINTICQESYYEATNDTDMTFRKVFIFVVSKKMEVLGLYVSIRIQRYRLSVSLTALHLLSSEASQYKTAPSPAIGLTSLQQSGLG